MCSREGSILIEVLISQVYIHWVINMLEHLKSPTSTTMILKCKKDGLKFVTIAASQGLRLEQLSNIINHILPLSLSLKHIFAHILSPSSNDPIHNDYHTSAPYVSLPITQA